MVEHLKHFCDIFWHGDVDGTFNIVPRENDTMIRGSGPVGDDQKYAV